MVRKSPYERPNNNTADSHLDELLERVDSLKAKFTCQKLLGQGSYGKVYLGQANSGQAELGSVAIKKIVTSSKALLDDVNREIWYMTQARGHSNLCQLLQAYRKNRRTGSASTITCLVMEAYETNLTGLIQQAAELEEPIDFTRCLDHLSRGLLHLHDHHIIHRDLSTNNVFIRRTPGSAVPDFVIGDFGLSRQFQNNEFFPEFKGNSVTSFVQRRPAQPLTSSLLRIDAETKSLTTRVTTREFRAPEIFLESPNYTASIDCWSLGVILFSVAFGHYPFALGRNSSSYEVFENGIWTHFNNPCSNPYGATAPLNWSELDSLVNLGPPIQLIESFKPTVLQRYVLSNLLLLAPSSRFTMRKLRHQFELDKLPAEPLLSERLPDPQPKKTNTVVVPLEQQSTDVDMDTRS